jgi:hypothetical protein
MTDLRATRLAVDQARHLHRPHHQGRLHRPRTTAPIR